MEATFLTNELKNFLDKDGRLKNYPTKHKPKILSLFYLASKVEAEKRYTEKELNQLLREWHTFEDWAMLRRDLYDRHFLNREGNGSFYWLEENQPSLASFGLEQA